MATNSQDSKEQILHHCLKGLLRREDCFDIVPSKHAGWICERLSWHKLLPLAAALENPRKKKMFGHHSGLSYGYTEKYGS